MVDKENRDRIARLLEAQPVRFGHKKMPEIGAVLISPMFRDRLVQIIRQDCECQCYRPVFIEKEETKVCFGKKVEDRPGLWKIFKWAGEKLHG